MFYYSINNIFYYVIHNMSTKNCIFMFVSIISCKIKALDL